jgi:parallel beta-helix repeat protein
MRRCRFYGEGRIMRRLIPPLGIVMLVLALTPAASATSGTLFISSDTTLTEDHYGNIVITADNVTLDCAGFTVHGPGPFSDGIRMNNRSGVTIKHCNVTGFAVGFLLVSSTGNHLVDDSATGNGNGFALLFGSNYNELTRDSASNNGAQGFAIENSANHNELRDSQAIGNGGNGVNVFHSDGNAFTNNSILDNTHHGLGFDHSNDSTIAGNAISGNRVGVGFAHCRRDQLTGNTIMRSTELGVYLNTSDGNLFTGNSIAQSSGAGIVVNFGSSANTLEQNDVSENDGTGIALLDGSFDNTLIDNRVSGNGDAGVQLLSANDNTLHGNLAEDNTSAGFSLDSSNTNSFHANAARRNGIGLGMHQSSGNVFTTNRFIDSGPEGWGVWIADSSNDNRFANNIAQGNDYEGFAIVGSSGNELLHNISQESNYQGISLYFGAEHNVVRANVTTDNAGSGVLVVQSSHNSITDNRSMLNNPKLLDPGGGITVIEGSSFNEILRNVACNNGNADGYDDGTGTDNVWEANVFCTTNGIPIEELEVYFNDLEGFNLAADSPAIAVTFDDLTTPLDITGSTLGGIGFDLGDGPSPSAPLKVVAGADTFTVETDFSGIIDATTNQLFPTSGTNVLSPGGAWLAPGPDPLAENDDLDLQFPGEVRAVGFDVLFQSLDCCSYVAITVFGPNGHVLYSNQMIPTSSVSEGGDPGGHVFVGFVSKSMRIARILVDEFDENNEYPDSNVGYDTFRVGSTVGGLTG